MMKGQADLLNDGKTIESVDEKLCSFSSDEPEEMYSSSALATCRSRMFTPSGEFVEILDLRGGNEESSAEATGCKASVYAEFDDCAQAENFIGILSFRHFSRKMMFERTGDFSRKKVIQSGFEVSVVLHLV